MQNLKSKAKRIGASKNPYPSCGSPPDALRKGISFLDQSRLSRKNDSKTIRGKGNRKEAGGNNQRISVERFPQVEWDTNKTYSFAVVAFYRHIVTHVNKDY